MRFHLLAISLALYAGCVVALPLPLAGPISQTYPSNFDFQAAQPQPFRTVTQWVPKGQAATLPTSNRGFSATLHNAIPGTEPIVVPHPKLGVWTYYPRPNGLRYGAGAFTGRAEPFQPAQSTLSALESKNPFQGGEVRPIERPESPEEGWKPWNSPFNFDAKHFSNMDEHNAAAQQAEEQLEDRLNALPRIKTPLPDIDGVSDHGTVRTANGQDARRVFAWENPNKGLAPNGRTYASALSKPPPGFEHVPVGKVPPVDLKPDTPPGLKQGFPRVVGGETISEKLNSALQKQASLPDGKTFASVLKHGSPPNLDSSSPAKSSPSSGRSSASGLGFFDSPNRLQELEKFEKEAKKDNVPRYVPPHLRKPEGPLKYGPQTALPSRQPEVEEGVNQGGDGPRRFSDLFSEGFTPFEKGASKLKVLGNLPTIRW